MKKRKEIFKDALDLQEFIVNSINKVEKILSKKYKTYFNIVRIINIDSINENIEPYNIMFDFYVNDLKLNETNFNFIYLGDKIYYILEKLLKEKVNEELKKYNGEIVFQNNENDFSYKAFIKIDYHSNFYNKMMPNKIEINEKLRIVKFNIN